MIHAFLSGFGFVLGAVFGIVATFIVLNRLFFGHERKR
jgi:hypothetical protein